MNLHNNEEQFVTLIEATANYFNLNPAIVEKDYYVTLFLSKAKDEISGIVFKGGTSLSKCYKIIDRFSEDIDLTLENERFTTSIRRNANKAVEQICEIIGLELLNKDEIYSRRNYNCFNVAYPISYDSSDLKPELKVEMTFFEKAFPKENRTIDSLIGEFLRIKGRSDLSEKFGLNPFEIKVQSLERTFVDKVFAICDYKMSNKSERQSRHIYDVSRLLTKIEINDELKKLVLCVREERKNNEMCLSAKDNVCIPQMLQEIVEREYYKKDYEENTVKLLSKPLAYDEAIKSILLIIKSNLFDFTK